MATETEQQESLAAHKKTVIEDLLGSTWWFEIFTVFLPLFEMVGCREVKTFLVFPIIWAAWLQRG